MVKNNNILINSTHNEVKSVIIERFIKTVKVKIYKKMRANDSKFHVPYLKRSVDQYNNTYHHSIGEKPINADYSALTKKNDSKAPKFKVNNRIRITKLKIFLVKVALKISQDRYLLLIPF